MIHGSVQVRSQSTAVLDALCSLGQTGLPWWPDKVKCILSVTVANCKARLVLGLFSCSRLAEASGCSCSALWGFVKKQSPTAGSQESQCPPGASGESATCVSGQDTQRSCPRVPAIPLLLSPKASVNRSLGTLSRCGGQGWDSPTRNDGTVFGGEAGIHGQGKCYDRDLLNKRCVL